MRYSSKTHLSKYSKKSISKKIISKKHPLKTHLSKRTKKVIDKKTVTGKHKSLIIIPAGDNSRHRYWDFSDYENIHIHLCIVYYGNNEDVIKEYMNNSDIFIKKKGPKWELISYAIHHIGIHNLLKYEYVWFPDDDLDFDVGKPSMLIYYAKINNLVLSQPSLLDNGNITKVYKNILKKEDKTIEKNKQLFSVYIKYSTFVEIMCPLFKINGLLDILPTFLNDNQVQSGWGLDEVWPIFLRKKYGKYSVGIINIISVIHTRPPNKPTEGFYKEYKINTKTERYHTLDKFKEIYKLPVKILKKIIKTTLKKI